MWWGEATITNKNNIKNKVETKNYFEPPGKSQILFKLFLKFQIQSSSDGTIPWHFVVDTIHKTDVSDLTQYVNQDD